MKYSCFSGFFLSLSSFAIIYLLLFLYLLQADEMVVKLRESLNELFDEVEWMDDHTRRLAKEKVGIMNSFEKKHTFFLGIGVECTKHTLLVTFVVKYRESYINYCDWGFFNAESKDLFLWRLF